MEVNLLFAFITSLAISMILIPPLMRLSDRFQILDPPGGRKTHAMPMPRVGGIAFAAGIWVTLLIWAPKQEVIIAYLVGSGIILLFGIWDDRMGLDYRIKFLGQLFAAAIVVGYGEVSLNTLPLIEDVGLSPWLAVPLTIVMLVGITNAINLSDGLDGLAGGLCLLTFGGMAYLAYLSGDLTVLLLAVSTLGGILGFLRFNTYPARIFMGDAGSQFLGFTAGLSVLVLTNTSQGSYAPVLGLFMIGLPLLDTLGVMAQRVAKGCSPFLPDRNHIHHKLLEAGFFHHEAVLIIYTVQALMVGLAYFLQWQQDIVVLAVYGMIALSVFCVFWLAGRGRFRWHRPDREHSASVAVMHRVIKGRWMTEMPVRLLGMGVLLFLALGAFVPRQIPMDFGLVAMSLFGLLLAGVLFFRKVMPFLVRLGLYVGGAFMIYLADQPTMIMDWPVHAILNLLFGMMAILVMMSIWLSRKQPFQTTPLDYLIVLAALVVPNLPEIRIGELSLGLIAAKIIVLFFAYELVLSRLSERMTHYGLASLWVLLACGIRAWVQ